MSSIKNFDFLSRNCRTFKHVDCYGRWSGLGLSVLCSCLCHKKEELEKQFRGTSSSSRQSSSVEVTVKDDR
jgi:hypothetical protein